MANNPHDDPVGGSGVDRISQGDTTEPFLSRILDSQTHASSARPLTTADMFKYYGLETSDPNSLENSVYALMYGVYEQPQRLDEVVEAIEGFFGWILLPGFVPDPVFTQRFIDGLWSVACMTAAAAAGVPAAGDSPIDFPGHVSATRDRLVELLRRAAVEKPEWDLTVPNDLAPVVWTVRIPPLAYLRAMANLFWSAVRHPWSETTIDLSTGRVLYRI